MLKHLRMLNPFVRIATEAEARTAARAGAVGAYLGAIQAGVGVVTLAVTSSTLADAMRQSMIATMPPDIDPDRVVMAMKAIPGMIVGMTILSAAVAIACAVLGAIQWRKLTRLIPLLLLLFAVFKPRIYLEDARDDAPRGLPRHRHSDLAQCVELDPEHSQGAVAHRRIQGRQPSLQTSNPRARRERLARHWGLLLASLWDVISCPRNSGCRF